MSRVHIVYTSRPDSTREGELSTLAAVYRFILFESSANKKGGPATAPDDARKDQDARTTEKCTE